MDGWADTQHFGVHLFTCLPRPDFTNLSVQRGAFRLLLCLYISMLYTPCTPPTRPVKSFKLHSAQALSTSVQNMIK